MADAKNLMILRLSTGEEIMGEVLVHSDKIYQIKNPVRVVVVPSKADPNNPSVGFAPFMQWTDRSEEHTSELQSH